MKARVSIIIPAYNAARTVEATVQSVVASSIPLEVWVVDDGSTDDTGVILDRLAARMVSDCSIGQSCLHILRQPNSGAYMARLNALSRITTPWFGFVDADDSIEPNMYEKMLDFGERNACDVVQCGVDGVDEDRVLGMWYRKILEGRKSAVLEDVVQVHSRFVEPHLVEGDGASFIWNKLYRNKYDFTTFATFDRLTNYDDMIFNFQFFKNVSRMGFLREPLYHYSATAGSVTHSYGERQFHDLKACAETRRTFDAYNRRWVVVNVRSSAITVLRSSLSPLVKLSWICRLACFLMGELVK